MRGTSIGIGWLLGICLVQQWAAVPVDAWRLCVCCLVVIYVGLGWLLPGCRPAAWPAAALFVGMIWAGQGAQARLDEGLARAEDNRVTRVDVTVTDLPSSADNGVRFMGKLAQSRAAGLPEHVLVFWQGACTGTCAMSVEPGQRWRMALRFRQPSARLNFAGFDGEAWAFQQGIRATASVRGEPTRLGDASGWQPGIWIEQVRSHIRRRLLNLLQDKREVNVMVALAIGDQQGVSAKDWEVFNLSGITHLVSISGSHVTLIAALGAAFVAGAYRRVSWRTRPLAERFPVRLVFVWSAGILAFFYCLLAGWGVPAQRTFFMLLAGAVGLGTRLPVSGAQAVVYAGVVMTWLDPWSVLSTGFWLSFGAMSLLVLLAHESGQQIMHSTCRWRRWLAALWVATRMQWIMTLALAPVTIYLFQQVSFVSLPANAWAIPWVTFVATPLALLVSALCLLPLPDGWLWPLAWLAHTSLEISLAPVRWLASFDWLAMETSALSASALTLALIGVSLGLALPPFQWRWMTWLLIVPSLLPAHRVPVHGQWRLTAFDVGQGGAVLVQTQTQALLFDTGWRYGDVNATERVLLAELRALGIKHLDRVIVSHPDIDHVGGLDALLQKRSVGMLMGSGLQRPDFEVCKAGQAWQADGVMFEVLHPRDDCGQQALSGALRNRCSCVVSVRGAWHQALLTGDIDTEAESGLLPYLKPPYEVVMMAHHGSKTASSDNWIRKVHALHAVAQAGHYNRFAHPHAEVVQRWQDHGVTVWVSSEHGAVEFESTAQGLRSRFARAERARYWHASSTESPSLSSNGLVE